MRFSFDSLPGGFGYSLQVDIEKGDAWVALLPDQIILGACDDGGVLRAGELVVGDDLDAVLHVVPEAPQSDRLV
jgi:hypothetical protein